MNRSSDDSKRLVDYLSQHSRLVVAFSGGVDSSVVLAAACRANIESVAALTAQSPSVARWQLDQAIRVANELGVTHHIVNTDEMGRDEYRRNDRRRCYYCKDTLYQTLQLWSRKTPEATIVSGTNADDLGDYRPGISAGDERGVLTPLATLGIGKQQVRRLAREFGLSNHNLPASPCLASRLAYGVEVTAERLRCIESAESYLHDLGFQQVRVRLLPGESARIEVEQSAIAKLKFLNEQGEVERKVLQMGFHAVTIDDRGFRSGRLNDELAESGLVQLRLSPASVGTELSENAKVKEAAS